MVSYYMLTSQPSVDPKINNLEYVQEMENARF